MTGPNGSVGGGNSVGGVNKVLRSQSYPNLAGLAAQESLDALRHGLRHLSDVDPHQSSGGHSSDGPPQGSGGNSQRRHSDSDVMGRHSPSGVASFQHSANGSEDSHSDTSGGGLHDFNGTPVQGGAVDAEFMTPVKGTQSQAVGGTSPLRTSALSNLHTVAIKKEIKEALNAAFEPSHATHSAGISSAGFSSFLAAPSSKSLSPTQIASSMATVYRNQPGENLDLFLEAFGEVLAEKGTANPEVFHAFFQQNLGSSLFHRESMISRFSNGFEHRLKGVENLRVSHNPLDASTAKMKILHANIGGGDSCIQSLGKTLLAVASSLTGNIDGEDPRLRLIYDIADILMSETNRGVSSDQNSGISTLRNALLASPNLAYALAGTQAGNAIAAALETEYANQNAALGAEVRIEDLANPETPFYDALKLAMVLDILSPVPDSCGLTACVMHHLDPTAINADESIPTREASIFLRVKFPDMPTDFSGVATRADLEGAKKSHENNLMASVETVIAAVPSGSTDAMSENFRLVLSLFFKTANEDNNEITAKQTARLRELQAAFTEKLTAGIVLPATRDGDWQTAANALRELNIQFVDLYRDTDEGAEYQPKKDQLTDLASRVMGGYRDVAGAGLQTATDPPITGEYSVQLDTITTRLDRHVAHQDAFLKIFANAPAESPMQAAMGLINSDIQRPINALLTRKVQVAEAKLNAATATLKGALQTLYIALGKDHAIALEDATAEATRRKTVASANIKTDDGLNTQANTTSVAADGLMQQSRDIAHLARAYTAAKQQIEGVIDSAGRDLNGVESALVTEENLQSRQDALDKALTDVLHRFSTSGSSDPAVAGIRDTLKQNKDSALSDGIGAIHDFAASGIKDRPVGDSDADRLTYLQTQATRLGRFLPDNIRAEKNRLLASENARLAAEQSDAARAAKASTLRDISKSKDDLGPIRESLDDIRSRRPADEVRDNAAKTDVLGDRLRELPDLHQGSSELEIDAYQTAIGLYREGMMTELDILKTAQTKDLSQLTKLMGIYDGVVRQYNTEVSIPHTPSANFQNHSNALHAQGEKPHAKTMSELSATIRADIHAIKQSRTEKSEALETANRQFATATTDLEAKLRVFYTAIGADDTAAAVATAKATAAKTSANVDGDLHIDVQTTRMTAATGVITAETKTIGQLTGHYGTAQKAIATAVRAAWATPGLQTKLDIVLADFDRQASMPGAERAAARQSLQTMIAMQLSASAAAAALLAEADAPPPAPKKVAQPNPIDPNIAIRRAQEDTLNRVTEELTSRLNDFAKHATLDVFQEALTTGLQTLRDAAADAPLVSPDSKVKKAFDALLASVTTAQGMGEVLISARPTDEKLETLRAWEKQCQPVADSLNTIPKEWKLPLTTELKKYQALRVTKEAALRTANETLQKLGATLTATLQAGGTSIEDARAIVWQILADARTETPDDVLASAEKAIPSMDDAIAVATENNRVAAVARAEVAAMAIATQRLQTVTQNIRAEYAGDPAQDTRVTDEVDNAQAQVVTHFGDGPATSTSTTAKAQILEARLAEIRETKRAVELAAAQALMATARQGVSDATAVLGDRLSAWASVAGLAVPTTEMIVADMVTKLFSGRSKESLSPEELDTLRQHIDLRSVAYQDITAAANDVVVTWGYQDLARGVIAEVIYGDTAVPTKPKKSIIATEKLHDAAQTLRVRTMEINAATAASRIRTSDLEKLDTLKTQLEKVLDRRADTMVDRRVLLQDAVRLLGTISTETERLFPDTTSKEDRSARAALRDLSTKVQTTYSRFCTMDSQDLLSQSTGTLGSVGTASSSGLEGVENGLRSGHAARRNAFETAYTIEGLSSAPRDVGLVTLDGFARQLSGAVAGRRGQLDSIRRAYVAANNQLAAAFGDATQGIDFKKTTASELNAKTSAFTAACDAAERGMNTALRNIPPDEDQPQVFGPAVTKAHEKLKAAFTKGVSTILQSNIRAFDELIADMDIYTTEDPSTYTALAFRLRARATDLRDFMKAELGYEINTITQRHFDQVLATANEAATQAIARATAALTDGIEPDTIGKEDLTSRMQQFQTALSDVLETFEAAVESLPVNTTITETLSGLTTSVRASGPIAKNALMTLVSTPLETQRQSIATLLTHEGVTLADLNAAQGQVHRLDQRSAELGKAWVSNMAEIDQTLSAYASKFGILKGTRNSQISAFTAAMNELTFIPTPNPFGMNLDDKWSAIRDHEGQFEGLNKDYAHLFEEETVDTRVTDAKTAGIERATAARENLAPETDAILSAIPALLTTLPADFDWDTTLATISEKLSPDIEIRATLTDAGQSIPGLEEAIRSRLIARDTLNAAQAALTAWRPGQPLETVSTHQANVLFLAFPAVPFDATAFDANLAVQTSGIATHSTAIQNLATPIRNTSLKDRWDDIYGQEQALVSLQTLDPFNNNVSLQSQISAISTHLDGYAVPSDLERALFIQRLQGVLGSSSLTPDQIRKEAQNNAQSQINNPKFQRAIQACHDGSSTLNVPIQERITYRQTLNTAEVLVGRMAGPEQTIGELTTTLSNLEGTPEAHTDFTSYDTYQKPRVDAAKVSITARIAELREHTRLLTAAVDTANTALETARRTAETLPRQVGTETADTLNARMTALDRDANAALAAFDTAVAGLPDNQARREARSALEFRTWTLDGATKTQLQNSVSAPLQTIKNEINGLLGRMRTTQADLENNARVVENLEARLNALGDTWLTAGLGDEIRTTIKAYDSRLDAMRTRTGQIQTLTDALNGLNFAVPANATLADKWNKIGENDNSQIALREHSDFFSLFNEEPKDPAITHALATLEARRTAAIEHRDPEQRALIAGLADQLGGLTTAGFDWEATLTTAETAARNALPVDLRADGEMQAALATAKRDLNGLETAVRTRVTAREALTTATNYLGGWPASTRSLADIQVEITAARTAFTNKAGTAEFAVWDTATDQAITALQRQCDAAVQRRDTLIAQFQAITTMAVHTDTLANRWTDIAAKETRLATLQTTAANIPILVDPQVTDKIAEVRVALGRHNTPTDLERAAFTAGMNTALVNPALMTADAVLDRAAASVTAGLPLDSPTLIRFQTAIATLQTSAATHLTAHINSRLDYRGLITTAAEVFAAVQDRTATTLQLQTAIGTIGAVPAIVDPGDGTNIFATADAAMATQRATVERGLVTHRALVTAFTDAITTATGQLPIIDGTTTTQAKWTALMAAKDTYTNGKTAAQYLFGATDPTIHPDVTVTNLDFTTQFNDRGSNIAPEARDIRRAAAERLTLCLTDSSHPIPVFYHLRNAVLNASVPATYQRAMSDALDTASRGEIEGEIQSRVDVHAALQDLEADTTAVTTDSVRDIQTQITGLASKASYTDCDTILQTRLTKLSRAAHQAAAIESINSNSSITKITLGGNTAKLIVLAQGWRALENSFQTNHPQYKFRRNLDQACANIGGEADSYIRDLNIAYDAIRDQLPVVYQSSMDRALNQLANRNTPPPLCAYALSAAIGTVLEGIDIVADTRGIVTENGNSGPVHKHIAPRAKDNRTFTGFANHGETSVLRQVLNAQLVVMTDFASLEHVTDADFTALVGWMTEADTPIFRIANPNEVTATEQQHFLDQIARSFPDLQVYTSSFVTDSSTPSSFKDFYDNVWQKIMRDSDELIQKYMRIQIQQLIDAMNASRR